VRDLDVAPTKLLEIMSESPGGTNALKNRAPKIAAALEGRMPDVGFDIDGMRKDLRTMVELARALDVELPAAAKVLEIYDVASKEGLRCPRWVLVNRVVSGQSKED